ncbi:MAG: hypothetical protein PHO94_11800, partial [Petrimonas sp.]|nr:hypothetical protein [Petrimonas sp.]
RFSLNTPKIYLVSLRDEKFIPTRSCREVPFFAQHPKNISHAGKGREVYPDTQLSGSPVFRSKARKIFNCPPKLL